MSTGYVLDFTSASFESLFRDIEIDIYDREKYPGFGDSKAERMRACGSGARMRRFRRRCTRSSTTSRRRRLAADGARTSLMNRSPGCARSLAIFTVCLRLARGPVAVTTEATVTNNKIQIEIHEDIYNHIEKYLATGDYFHAVVESYKVVREKLRDLAGEEAATDVFNMNAQSTKHYGALFGKVAPGTQAEGDFFRGVGYLHLGVQFLRNEKPHTLGTFLEPNLAVHYISLASLAYDLITRSVGEDTINELDELVREKRRSYAHRRGVLQGL